MIRTVGALADLLAECETERSGQDRPWLVHEALHSIGLAETACRASLDTPPPWGRRQPRIWALDHLERVEADYYAKIARREAKALAGDTGDDS